MKFKHYIVYGTGKGFESPEEFNEAFEKFGKVLKKYNMELLFWGGSFGTTESLVYVMKGKIEDYQSMFGNEDFRDANPFVGPQHTGMVLEF